MSLGNWPTDLPDSHGVSLPHEITTRITNSVIESVEELATVTRASVLDFRPAAIAPVFVSSWSKTALDRLHELASSEPDWDGYGAPRVHPSAIVASLHFLAQVATHTGFPPAIVATGEGNVQFEWRGRGYGIDVEIGPTSEYCATLFANGVEISEWHGDMGSGIDPDLSHVIGFGWKAVTR